MPSDHGGQEKKEVALIVFLVFVVLIALLTVLGPQIESLVQRVTGR